jgi:hypothetical protein
VSAGGARAWLAEHLAAVLVVGITAVVLAMIMVISYAHEVELASRNGQVPWVAGLIGFAVDGILVVASIALYWAGQHGITRPRPPLLTAAVGMVATIGANFVSDERTWWLGPAVAGSVGLAAVLVGWVAIWMVETQRKLRAGEPLQPAADCSCPPPPVTLAAALLLARARLRDLGEPAGEQALADRFGVTRNQVRKLLAPPADPGPRLVPPSAAGPSDVAGAVCAPQPAPATQNGSGPHDG